MLEPVLQFILFVFNVVPNESRNYVSISNYKLQAQLNLNFSTQILDCVKKVSLRFAGR